MGQSPPPWTCRGTSTRPAPECIAADRPSVQSLGSGQSATTVPGCSISERQCADNRLQCSPSQGGRQRQPRCGYHAIESELPTGVGVCDNDSPLKEHTAEPRLALMYAGDTRVRATLKASARTASMCHDRPQSIQLDLSCPVVRCVRKASAERTNRRATRVLSVDLAL